MLRGAKTMRCHGGAMAGASLVGASGSGTASGQSATYPNVLPGVTATYTVENDAVKEVLSLASPTATAVFAYSVQMSAGLTAIQNKNGSVDFLDQSGGPRVFLRPAPDVGQRRGPGRLGRGVDFALPGRGDALAHRGAGPDLAGRPPSAPQLLSVRRANRKAASTASSKAAVRIAYPCRRLSRPSTRCFITSTSTNVNPSVAAQTSR